MIKNIHIKELISGAFVSFGTRVLAFGFGYLFFMLLGQTYGAQGVGLYAFSFTLMSILGLISSLGTNTFLLREIGKTGDAKSEHFFSDFKFILRITIPIASFTGLILISCNQILATLFNDVLLTYSFIAVGIVLPIYVFLQLNSALFRGFRKIFLSEFFQMFGMHILNLLVLMAMLVLSTEKSLEDVMLIFVITFVALAFIGVGSIMKTSLGLKHSTESALEYRKTISSSWPMMISALSLLLLGSVDNIMLGAYVSVSEIGAYAIAIKVATVSSILLAAINTIMAPKIAHLFDKGHFNKLNQLIGFASKILMLSSLFVLMIIFIYPSEILGLFGSEFTEDNIVVVLLVVTLAQFFNSISGSVGIMMNMTNDQKRYRNVLLLALSFKVILNLILIPFYGLLGAAIASLVSTITWNFYLVYYIKKRHSILTMYIPKLLFKRVN